jgi:hypothetical protein
MQAEEHTRNEEPATDGDLALDRYSLQVLEVILKILKTQQREGKVSLPPP